MKQTVTVDGKVYQVTLSPIKDGTGRVVDFKVISTAQVITHSPVRVRFISQNLKPFGKEAV
jgi:hypothetical protein